MRTPIINEAPDRSRGGWQSASTRHCDDTTGEQVALAVHKRNRTCVIAKLVFARPLNELVIAMPYRNRAHVQHVSLPPAALQYARTRGVKLWLVRFDVLGECYALDLNTIERVGWLWRSNGRPEWFVPLSKFASVGWQDWDYVEDTIVLDEPSPRQLALPGVER